MFFEQEMFVAIFICSVQMIVHSIRNIYEYLWESTGQMTFNNLLNVHKLIQQYLFILAQSFFFRKLTTLRKTTLTIFFFNTKSKFYEIPFFKIIE